MKTRSGFGALSRAVLVAATAAALFIPSARAADHLDSPKVKTNHELDINDVYVFQSPTHADRTVLIMTVYPLAGMNGPAMFSPDGMYQFLIDNTGDAVEDMVFDVSFSAPNRKGVQKMVIEQTISGRRTKVIARGQTGKTEALSTGGQAQAYIYDDPFFFDLNAFNMFKTDLNPKDFCNPGSNFFKGLNVLAIVMEVPSKAIQASKKSTKIGVWARTLDGAGEQFDRMGRPAINTALIPAPMKDAFNAGTPSTDPAMFGQIVTASLLADGNTPAEASQIVALLLPDMNTFDTSSKSGFPNGRMLADDVIDTEFSILLKNAGVTTDCVGNDSTFRGGFPYLGTAN